MDLGLGGKVAVITGGSIGIGLAVAEGLAAEGANLVLAARQGERLDEEAKRVAAKYGVRAVPVICDVATAEGCAALIATARTSSAAPTSSSTMPAPDRTRPSRKRRTRSGSTTGTSTSWRRSASPAAWCRR